MIRWSFDDDHLLDLVIAGKKRATCSVYSGKITPIGEESIITRDGKDAVKIKVTAVKVFKFKEAKEDDVGKIVDVKIISEHLWYLKGEIV